MTIFPIFVPCRIFKLSPNKLVSIATYGKSTDNGTWRIEMKYAFPGQQRLWTLLLYLSLYTSSTVWVKNSPPLIFDFFFWHFFQNGWEFLVQTLHTYYTFPFTLDYKFLSNYLQLWRSYAIYSATSDHHYMLKMSTISWNTRGVVALSNTA